MREISTGFAAGLAAATMSLCACWRFERRDGQVFGATDHDQAIVFDGVSYAPANGVSGATLETGAGLSPGRAAAAGVLDADFIDEADLAAGLWDGARVDVWRVDWSLPAHRVRIWSGRLSEVGRTGAAFTAELVSLKADLERLVGRVYRRSCDAAVGDVRCGVDLSAGAYRGDGETTETLGGGRFHVSGLDGFETGWFVGGVLTWLSGANAGAVQRVVRHVGSEIELSATPRFEIAAGDAFKITAGCDKSFAVCGDKFGNRVNFRGFPHLPGMDAVLAGPASDRPNDGGRRE